MGLTPPALELTGSRTKPMEVLGLGLLCTRMDSINDALLYLGYTPYNRIEMRKHPGHAEKWPAGVNSKYDGDGSLLTREYFDELLEGYSAIVHYPGILFAEELIAAYPEAKVVLSKRTIDPWDNTMEGCAYATEISKVLKDPELDYKYFKALYRNQLFDDYSFDGRVAYEWNNAIVRSLIPPDSILEFGYQDG